MKKSKIFLLIGCLMLAAAICFVIYALQHPEGFLNISVKSTYILYAIYVLIMLFMFGISLILNIKQK